jgi:hypothetical protein
MKTWLMILITVIATGGISGVGTYYYLNNKNDKDISVLQKQIDDLKKPVAVVDETADWKTYTNTEVGFSFKYPKDWEAKNYSEGGNIVSVISPENQKRLQEGKEMESYSYNLVVSYWKSINEELAMGGQWVGQRKYTDLADFLTDKNSSKQKISATTVDGKNGYFVGLGGYGSSLGVMVENNGIYQFNFASTNGQSLGATELKVLNTFKFDETLTWKTYTNTVEGYSIKYPKDWFVEYSNGQAYPGQSVPDTKKLYISSTKIVPCTSSCLPGPYSSALQISSETLATGKVLAGVATDLKSNNSGVTYKEESLTIGGQPAIKLTSQCEGLACGNPIWVLVKDSKSFTFNSNIGYEETYDKIVATLQFTK